MTTISAITSANRTVSIKTIDFRICSDIRDLEYHISVGEQTLCMSHEELIKVAELSVSLIKPSELKTSMKQAKELIDHLDSFVARETVTQLLVEKHSEGGRS